jgi:hypothetical protein
LGNLKNRVEGLVVESPRDINEINGLDTHVILSLHNTVIYNDNFKYIPDRLGESLAKAFPDWFPMSVIENTPAFKQFERETIREAENTNIKINQVIEFYSGDLVRISRDFKL